MDDDFDEALKSDIADIKQCSTENAGDHILAARFLSRFVPAATPWIHVDLNQKVGGQGPFFSNAARIVRKGSQRSSPTRL